MSLISFSEENVDVWSWMPTKPDVSTKLPLEVHRNCRRDFTNRKWGQCFGIWPVASNNEVKILKKTAWFAEFDTRHPERNKMHNLKHLIPMRDELLQCCSKRGGCMGIWGSKSLYWLSCSRTLHQQQGFWVGRPQDKGSKGCARGAWIRGWCWVLYTNRTACQDGRILWWSGVYTLKRLTQIAWTIMKNSYYLQMLRGVRSTVLCLL